MEVHCRKDDENLREDVFSVVHINTTDITVVHSLDHI